MTDQDRTPPTAAPDGASASSEGPAYQRLVESVDTPMLVVTAFDGEERSGCLVGFSTRASMRPARHLVMLSKENHTFGVATRSPALVVHVLRADDTEMAERFGEQSGDRVDKFDGLDVQEGPGGAPVLVGLDWFAGRVIRQFDCGDHVGFLLAPHDGTWQRAGEAQFGSRRTSELEPGHPA